MVNFLGKVIVWIHVYIKSEKVKERLFVFGDIWINKYV
jgi:hypothetical protein